MNYLSIIDNTAYQTFAYAYLALSMYISLRLLDFPDLSIEGSFPLGAAITIFCIQYTGSTYLSFFMAIVCGFIVGCITAILHTKVGIGRLLCGILTAIGLYSINFRLMGAKANVFVLKEYNALTHLRNADAKWVTTLFGPNVHHVLYFTSNLVLLICMAFFIFILYRLFLSERGSIIRFSRPDAKLYLEAHGFNYNINVLIGMGIANSLACLSGSLVCFQSGTASISMGFGIILVALVSLVLGEQIIKLFHKDINDLWPTILAPALGTYVYFLIVRGVRAINTEWQIYFGYIDPHDQLQFFSSDIKVLAALIMVMIYIFKKQQRNELGTPERL